MRWIKDSIHGDVYVNEAADALLGTAEMQRLRRVKQTSFSNLIYPGANHTRLEHSIGTYYLTSRACFFNKIEKSMGTKLMIGALLHDVGHTALSHALEPVFKKHTGKNHKEQGFEMINGGEMKEALESNGISPREIVGVFSHPMGKAISGYLGTDKMDYLLRDAYYTGIGYGTVDKDRLLRKVLVREDGVVLDERGISAAEAMLMSRFLMYANVYKHPVSIGAGYMAMRAAEFAISGGSLKAEELATMDDGQLMNRLLDSGGVAADIAARIQNRRLFKVAASRRIKEYPNWLYLGDMSERDIREIEGTIAGKAGVGAEEIIFRIPRPWFQDVGMRVLKNGDYYSLDETSLITRLLKEAQWDYHHVMVLCAPECEKEVSKVDLSFLESFGGSAWQL